MMAALRGLAMGHAPASATERAKWNRAVKILRDAGATPADVRDRVRAYRRTYPAVACTPLAVAAHWGELAPRRPRPVRVEDVAAQIAAFARQRSEWPLVEIVDDAVARWKAVPAVDVERAVRAALTPAGQGGIIPSSTRT